MSEIPEDIRTKAITVCMDIYCGFTPPEYVEWVAEAILAERNRWTDTAKALTRQCDNMAFLLNHASIPDQWYYRFCQEVDEDRRAIHNGRT